MSESLVAQAHEKYTDTNHIMHAPEVLLAHLKEELKDGRDSQNNFGTSFDVNIESKDDLSAVEIGDYWILSKEYKVLMATLRSFELNLRDTQVLRISYIHGNSDYTAMYGFDEKPKIVLNGKTKRK